MMMQGKWYNLNSYGLQPTGNAGSIDQYNTNSQINVASANVEYTITSANVVGGTDDWTINHLDGANYSDGIFTITKAGRYLLTWSLSFYCVSNNKDIEGGIMVNGVNPQKGWAQRRIGTASDVGNFGASAIINLIKNDKVGIAVMNITSASDIFINHGSFSIVRVR
jgi:hypothetical protein